MTRAADRLVVASYRTGRGDTPEAAWCAMVRRSLAAQVGRLVEAGTPHGPAHHWREGTPAPLAAGALPAPAPVAELPSWLRAPPAPEAVPAPPLRPSASLAAADPRAARALREGRAGARLLARPTPARRMRTACA